MVKEEIVEVGGIRYVLETSGGEETYLVERLFDAETGEPISYRAFTVSRVYFGSHVALWSAIDKIRKGK